MSDEYNADELTPFEEEDEDFDGTEDFEDEDFSVDGDTEDEEPEEDEDDEVDGLFFRGDTEEGEDELEEVEEVDEPMEVTSGEETEFPDFSTPVEEVEGTDFDSFKMAEPEEESEPVEPDQSLASPPELEPESESEPFKAQQMSESLQKEYDANFSDEERIMNMLKVTSDMYTRTRKVINLKEVCISEPLKLGREQTMVGLTKSVKEMGVLTPIHVMTMEQVEDEDDEPDDMRNYKYILLDGLRRVFGALKNQVFEVDAIVWDFPDKEKGRQIALPLSLLLNRTQRRKWSEIWELFQILEMQSSVTPGTLEYLLQLEPGDAMKLKDCMLCDYEEVKECLLNNEKTLEQAYKLLQKLRKEENMLEKEETMGISNVEEAQEIVGDASEGKEGLSEQDVRELLEMADSDIDVDDEDFGALNQGEDHHQKVGEREPLDPALRQAVLSRDDFRCQICGVGGPAFLSVLAVHHKISVAAGGADALDNLITLCLTDHIMVHVAERNGGKLQITKEEYDDSKPEEQKRFKKILKYSKIIVEANKRKGFTREQIFENTKSVMKHPMPGAGLAENRKAYVEAKKEEQEQQEQGTKEEE